MKRDRKYNLMTLGEIKSKKQLCITEEDEIKNDFKYKISTLKRESSIPFQRNISSLYWQNIKRR
jgi:hypothetical protein